MNREGAKGLSIIFVILSVYLSSFFLAGCGFTRGWRFEIGVAPVSQLENQAGLVDHEKNYSSAKEKY